jgi:cytochrome c oxidase subunit III
MSSSVTSIDEDPTGPPHVHHMDSATAYSAAKFGMWLFLATEVLLFAVMFTSFALFRWMYLDEFHQASKMLDWKLGALNTSVLLLSSFTAALAVDAAQKGNNKGVVRNILITVVCGFGFLIIKGIEYSAKYQHHLFPGQEEYLKHNTFFGLYFCMTGVHALHVVIGMAILTYYALIPAMRGRFSSRYYTPVELGALYWHLVDLIWIYLFPLLYLVG